LEDKLKAKRAVSSVVATILLILLTVMAAAILASFVIPFVKEQLSRSSECLKVQDRFYFNIMEGLNCYNSTYPLPEKELLLSVGAKGEKNPDNVIGFDITLKDTGVGNVVSVRNNGNLPNMNMFDGTHTLFIPRTGEFLSYRYTSSGSEMYTGAEIRTLLLSGKTCEMKSDEIKLGVC